MANTLLQSDTQEINQSAETVFSFFSDFRNIEKILPEGKIENFEASADHCSFYLVGISQLHLKIMEKTEFEKITYQSENNSYQIALEIHLKKIDTNRTYCHLEMSAEFPKIIKMMAEKPLKSVLNKMAEKIKDIQFPN